MPLLDTFKSLVPARWRTDVPVVPVVRLQGPIGMPSLGGKSLSIAGVAGALEKAFAFKRAPAVALIVNSPGGSAVQSRLIYQRIRSLAEEKEKKVHVFVEDAAASGGYMIACAGDEIVADPSSIVGSIGVVSASFGASALLDKLGLERRVHTAGERKAILDPFRPEKPEDVTHLESLQREIHEVFKDLVRERRGEKLKRGADLFDGLFWTGVRAEELGLVDRLGDLRGVLRATYGDKTKTVLVNPPREGLFFRRLVSGAAPLDRLAETAIASLEERALWARLGL